MSDELTCCSCNSSEGRAIWCAGSPATETRQNIATILVSNAIVSYWPLGRDHGSRPRRPFTAPGEQTVWTCPRVEGTGINRWRIYYFAFGLRSSSDHIGMLPYITKDSMFTEALTGLGSMTNGPTLNPKYLGAWPENSFTPASKYISTSKSVFCVLTLQSRLHETPQELIVNSRI
jgi:hypothetical protein